MKIKDRIQKFKAYFRSKKLGESEKSEASLSSFPNLHPSEIDDTLLAKIPVKTDVEAENLVTSTQVQEGPAKRPEEKDSEYVPGEVYLCRYTSNNAVYGWTVRKNVGWSRIFRSYTSAVTTLNTNPSDLGYSLTLDLDSKLSPNFSFERMNPI